MLKRSTPDRIGGPKWVPKRPRRVTPHQPPNLASTAGQGTAVPLSPSVDREPCWQHCLCQLSAVLRPGGSQLECAWHELQGMRSVVGQLTKWPFCAHRACPHSNLLLQFCSLYRQQLMCASSNAVLTRTFLLSIFSTGSPSPPPRTSFSQISFVICKIKTNWM
jgi:hypothetical protein